MTLLLQDTLVISPATVDKIEQEIEDLRGATDCADVVANKAALDAYDTSKLTDQSIVKVLQDESHNDAQTYYRYSKSSDSFTLIGELGPYYTKSEDDTLLAGKVDKVTGVTAVLYNVNSSGQQGTIKYDINAVANSIVARDGNNQINVAQTPTQNTNATSKKYVDDADSDKVDKTTSPNRIYGTSSGGDQSTYSISKTNASVNAIVQRDSAGCAYVATPTADGHATTKLYVDTADALKQNKSTIVTSDTTTLSVALVDNTIYNNTSAGLTTLDITIPANPTIDFSSEINFTSGSVATVVTGNDIVWLGDNVNEDTGFVPRSNCRYTVVFAYDGVNFYGLVRGVSL